MHALHKLHAAEGAGVTLANAFASLPNPRKMRCDAPEAHSRVEALARALSNDLTLARNQTSYTVHGLFGIFARADSYELPSGKTRRLPVDYAGVKTSFIYQRVCELARAGRVKKVCEVGFNAGLSSLLFLEAAPDARVLSFDLGDMPWSRYADRILHSAYPTRFPGVIFGDSAKTISARNRLRPLHCDVVLIDGSKTYDGRLSSIVDMRNASRTGAAVFLDEISTRACVDGSLNVHEGNNRCSRKEFWPAVRAYAHASRAGLLRVRECAWPPKYVDQDGICVGEFPAASAAHDEPTKGRYTTLEPDPMLSHTWGGGVIGA